jgi:hypothetical protein
MASEITVSLTVAASKGGISQRIDVPATLLTMTGSRINKLSQSIGFAAAEALQLGEMGTVGQVVIINMDATNFVTVTTSNGGVVMAKILPGDFLKLPAGSGTQAIYLQADTAAVLIEALVVEL